MEIGWTSFLFMGIAIILMWKISQYLRNELRIVPQDTFGQKFKVKFSIVIFSVILTVTILFIAAIISSAIASNASLSSTGEINEQLIARFTWPTLLPLTLMGLGLYISAYPLLETLYMGKGSQDGAMEIQKWIENNIVDRFRPPWSYAIAIFFFTFVYVVPPTIISYIVVIVNRIPYDPAINMSAVTMTTFIFLDWFMIFPIIYLTYYATIGSSQAWFAGLKANLRKNKTRLVYFIFAIFTFISVITNLFIYVPVLFSPETIEPAIPGEPEGFGGFLQNIITYFMAINPNTTELDWQNWNNFIQVVPLDFLLFFIVTCIFSILGFYAKFLNKEPLNRPILVFFAAYIVAGIAFQVFANIITKWPWAIPSENLWIDFAEFATDPTIKALMQIFIPAVVADKIFSACFLAYQLFFNKTLRETINETVLTQAINDHDIEVLKKYTKDKNPRIRKIVAEAVLHIIETNPIAEDTELMIPIFEDLIMDQDPNVVKAISPAIKIAAFRIPVEKLYTSIQLGFGTENSTNIDEMEKLVIDIGRIHPEKIQSLYEVLYSGFVPDSVKKSLMEVLQVLGQTFPELSYNIAIPMLERKNLAIKKGSIWIIKNLIHDFSAKYDQIYDRMKKIANKHGDPLRNFAIEIMGYIASKDEIYLNKFLNDYDTLKHLDEKSKEKLIGGLSQLVISYPEQIDKILPLITRFLSKKEKPVIIVDVVMGLGVISIQLPVEAYLEKIYPRVKEIVRSKDIIVKKGLIDVFKFLFQARADFLDLDQTKLLIIDFLTDDEPEIRSSIFEIVKTYELNLVLSLLITSLNKTKDDKKVIDLLMFLESYLKPPMIRRFIDDYNFQNQLYELLISQNLDNEGIRSIIVDLLCRISTQSKYLTEKSYSFLLGVLKGKNEHAAGLVLRFLGKIALILRNDPDAYSIDLDYKDYFEDLKYWPRLAKIEKSKKKSKHIEESEKIIAAIETLAKIYEVDSQKHEEIFQIFYELRMAKSEIIRANVIRTLSLIACDYQEIYFKFFKKEVESRWIEQSRLEAEVLPIIYDNIDSVDPEIQKAIIASVSLITDTYGSSAIVKEFLFKSLRRNVSVNSKINVIACLTRLNNVELEKDVILRLKKLTKDKDQIIRETAFRALCSIFVKMDSLSTYDKNTEKEKIKSYKRLQNAVIRHRYARDSSKNVKIAFIDEATEIAIKFPDLSEPMLYVKEFAQNGDQEISIKAVRAYFKYIGVHPEKIEYSAYYMRTFANSHYIAVKNILLKELLNHYRSGDDLKYYLPTLLKLAVDKDKTIRQKSLHVFKEIYEKTTEKLLYFIQLLIRLTRDKDPRIRVDSFELVAQLTFEFPKNMRQQSLVFDTFSRLSRDYDIAVKRAVASYLENLIKIFPDKINSVLQMTYNLLREKDRDIIQKCTNALRYVLFLYPEKSKDIRPIIIRFYRRTANPYLENLIKEFNKAN